MWGENNHLYPPTVIAIANSMKFGRLHCLTKNGSVISQGIDRGEEAQGPIPLTAELFATDR